MICYRIEPLLYHTLVIGTAIPAIDQLRPCSVDTLIRVARTKPPFFLRDSVRNLMLDSVPTDQIGSILSTCSRIDNFFLLITGFCEPSDTVLSPITTGMAPKHLYGLPANIFALTGRKSFRHSLFSELTHLELFDGFEEDEADEKEEHPARWTDLSNLPHLTHLALDRLEHIAVCPRILRTCNGLRALIILSALKGVRPAKLDILADEPRFVILPLIEYTVDWVRGALAGRDYWARADAFIARRISGEIEREAACFDVLSILISNRQATHICLRRMKQINSPQP
jgi:hypothetical protein